MMKHVSSVALSALAAMLAISVSAEEPSRPTAEFTPGELGIMKHVVASKFGIKEYCKQSNPSQEKRFEEFWSNYLESELPEMRAYAASSEFAADGATRFEDYVRDAKKNGINLESLTKTCTLILERRKI